jgi:hypothetical protein
MNTQINEDRFKRRLIGNLAEAGARSLKLNNKRSMKLREWVLAYLATELELSTEPLSFEEIRKYIDRWENSELSEESHKYYYVEKDSTGDPSLPEQIMRWL